MDNIITIVHTRYVFLRVSVILLCICWLFTFAWIGRRVLFGYQVVTRRGRTVRRHYSIWLKIGWACGVVLFAVGIILSALTL